MVSKQVFVPGGAEARLNGLGIVLPEGPTPLGTYVEAVHTGNLLFLSGTLPVVDRKPKYVGRLGKELDSEAGQHAARVAALAALAAAKQHLGSLDRVGRLVRLSVFVVVHGDFFDLPKVADGASNLSQEIFGADKLAVRSVVGVASLPLNAPVMVEVTLEIID